MIKQIISPLVVLVFGGCIVISNKSEKCFTINKEQLCVNEEFRPGSLIKEGDWSRVKLTLNRPGIFSSAVAYVERHGDSRDNPGKAAYDYAMIDAERNLEKLDENDLYELFKLRSAGREHDYLFAVKQSDEYIIYSCAFVHICSIQGSYEGKLSIRIDFDADGFDKLDTASLFEAFKEVQSKIIKE